MKLDIEISGYKDEIVISAVPRRFLAKVFKHCMGKNNTPYFANNCFKGVLYFDEDLARKFGESVGYEWKGWWEEDRFYHLGSFVFDSSLKIVAKADGEDLMEVYPSKLNSVESSVELDPMLAKLADDEVLILLGSVDKGVQTYTLDDMDGAFDPGKLSMGVDTFADFGQDDSLITSMHYDGTALTRGETQSKGKRMVEPTIFSPQGQELDLEDFPTADEIVL